MRKTGIQEDIWVSARKTRRMWGLLDGWCSAQLLPVRLSLPCPQDTPNPGIQLGLNPYLLNEWKEQGGEGVSKRECYGLNYKVSPKDSSIECLILQTAVGLTVEFGQIGYKQRPLTCLCHWTCPPEPLESPSEGCLGRFWP